MKEEIQLYEIDDAWTPQYPVVLQISTSEVESRIGGVRGKVAKAELRVKEGEQVLHRLALTQSEISRMISALRSAQQRMEPVSTRVPLEIKDRFVAKAEALGKTPAEYLRELIEKEVSG
jgi:ribosomal protein L16/L10AE